jgi:hypothetical protein
MTQEATLMTDERPARLEKVLHLMCSTQAHHSADNNPGTTCQILAEMSQDTIAKHVHFKRLEPHVSGVLYPLSM